eukprot:5780065-Pyramimonas_sp.AAC.1
MRLALASGEELDSGSDADPEEAKLVQLISLLQLSQDESGVRKYQQQLDDLRSARRTRPLSFDEAMAARGAAAEALDK